MTREATMSKSKRMKRRRKRAIVKNYLPFAPGDNLVPMTNRQRWSVGKWTRQDPDAFKKKRMQRIRKSEIKKLDAILARRDV
jgi:hypothetical protein